MNFFDKFQQLSKTKNSLLIAGIDTATIEMKTNKQDYYHYPSYINKLDFSIDFVNQVADFCVGVKINLGYWQGEQDGKHLRELVAYCHQKELLVLLDGKYSDIDSTNEVWIYFAKEIGVDAITIAPFAGNCCSTVVFSQKQNLAVFTMGLMSNSDFQTEINFEDQSGQKLYEHRIVQALKVGVDGFVLGATYPSTSKEVRYFLQLTDNKKILYLIPGVGSQKGNIESLYQWQIDFERCLINISRGLMFPKESDFAEQKLVDRQKRAARFYQENIQKYR